MLGTTELLHLKVLVHYIKIYQEPYMVIVKQLVKNLKNTELYVMGYGVLFLDQKQKPVHLILQIIQDLVCIQEQL